MTLDSTGHVGASGLSDVFDIIQYPSVHEQATVSSVAADASTEPRQLKISHTESVSNGVSYGRHLARLDLENTDSEVGVVQASAYLVLVNPGNEQTAITEAEVLNLVGQLVDLIESTDFVPKLLNGES